MKHLLKTTMNKGVESLDVFLNEVHVGSLSYAQQHDLSTFRLSDGYMSMQNPPTLSLSFKGLSGGFARTTQSHMIKLPPFFSNLLPEGPLREYLAKKSGLKSSAGEFYLLAALAEDLPGAVILRPSGSADPDLFTHRSRNDLIVPVDRQLSFSLAGLQLKFSALQNAGGGLTIPVSGAGGLWIAKLPSAIYSNIPENEFAMLRFASSVGISTPEARLIETTTIENLPKDIPETFGKALAVRRFDRSTGGHRLHIEDFAQVFNVFPEGKYDGISYRNIAEILWNECGEEAIAEFIRRLVFSIAIGNADMHLKNWSLLYVDGHTPTLAPAYDLVSTVVYIPEDRNLALNLAGEKAMDRIFLDSFRKMASRARLPERLVRATVIETIERIHSAWHQAKELFPPALLPALESHMSSVPLLKSTGPKKAGSPAKVSKYHEKKTSAKEDPGYPASSLATAKVPAHAVGQQISPVVAPMHIPPALISIRERLRSFADETFFEEDKAGERVRARFNFKTTWISISYIGHTPPKNIELNPVPQQMTIATLRGNNLILSFGPSSKDVPEITWAFEYLVYDGEPAWSPLWQLHPTRAPMSTENLLDLIHKTLSTFESTELDLSGINRVSDRVELYMQTPQKNYLIGKVRVPSLAKSSSLVSCRIFVYQDEMEAGAKEKILSLATMNDTVTIIVPGNGINIEELRVSGQIRRVSEGLAGSAFDGVNIPQELILAFQIGPGEHHPSASS